MKNMWSLRKPLSLLLASCIVFSFAGCQNNDDTPSESSISASPSQSDEQPLENSQQSDTQASQVTENLIVSASTLSYFSVDSTSEIHQFELLNNVISLVPSPTRYANNKIVDFLTSYGDAYIIDWMKFDNLTENAPPIKKTIFNMDSFKSVVGNNLFLKEDNSLWTFSEDIDNFDEMFPLDAADLSWIKVFDNVSFAASSADGE